MADPKIEVWSKKVTSSEGRANVLGSQHLYIVYTDENGQPRIIRGGPENKTVEDVITNGGFGKVEVEDVPYTTTHRDRPKPGEEPHTLVSTYTGVDAANLYQQMSGLAQQINSWPTIYSPINDNSNTVPAYLLNAVGLGGLLDSVSRFPVPGKVWAPGADGVFMDYYDDDLIAEWVEPFSTAASTPVSPIILDLDGDGVETVGLNPLSYFDHAGDGFAEQTGWAGADDGLLVWDRNGDGRINDGKELFGSETILASGTKATNGYAALAELDTNADGRIDASDTAFANLKVWEDLARNPSILLLHLQRSEPNLDARRI